MNSVLWPVILHAHTMAQQEAMIKENAALLAYCHFIATYCLLPVREGAGFQITVKIMKYPGCHAYDVSTCSLRFYSPISSL